VRNNPLDFPGEVSGRQMGVSFRCVRICIVDCNIGPHEAGHHPQCLFDLLFIAARDADTRRLPQMLKRIVDKLVRGERVI